MTLQNISFAGRNIDPGFNNVHIKCNDPGFYVRDQITDPGFYGVEELITEPHTLLGAPSITFAEALSKFSSLANKPTKKQLEAREKLYQLVASNGIDYLNAQNNVEEIEKKYGEDCQSYYKQEQPQTNEPHILIHRLPYKGFDPTKISDEKDRDMYYASIRAMQEIERNYSALFGETGLKPTTLNDPSKRTSKPIGLNFDCHW